MFKNANILQIFDVLDELYQQTIVETPKTKNEQEFVATYRELLSKAFKESKIQRCFSPEKSWQPFKNVDSYGKFIGISLFFAAHRHFCPPKYQERTSDFRDFRHLAVLGQCAFFMKFL